jgi:hypothetical protein
LFRIQTIYFAGFRSILWIIISYINGIDFVLNQPDAVNLIHNAMLKNYIKTAFRSLSRRKGHAFLNITGLSVGFAAFLLIFLVINYEESFDSFHVNKDRIFRVVRTGRNAANDGYGVGIPLPVTEALRKDCPQLAKVGCIYSDNNAQVIISEKAVLYQKNSRNTTVFLLVSRSSLTCSAFQPLLVIIGRWACLATFY